MNRDEFLSLICCPNCQSDLSADENKFLCMSCESEFREKNGILILISKELEDELRS